MTNDSMTDAELVGAISEARTLMARLPLAREWLHACAVLDLAEERDALRAQIAVLSPQRQASEHGTTVDEEAEP